MSATDVQVLLRFLTKDAKLPLATAMGKFKDLQQAGLSSPESIAQSDIMALVGIFNDDKVAKSVLNAAKRISKKRSSGQADLPSPQKRQRRDPFEVSGSTPASEVEAFLVLPSGTFAEEELEKMVFITNRAPLVLAFAATLVKYTMPNQPPSSRLSLAQAVVSLGSQSKAKMIGLSTAATAEDEGWGQGQPVVKVMNREISVLKRWGYEWRTKSAEPGQDDVKREETGPKAEQAETESSDGGEAALWAIDLEQLKHLNGPLTFSSTSTTDTAGLPVYSPQAARGYLYRSFDTAVDEPEPTKASPKKKSAAMGAAQRETNVSALLQCLDMVFESWKATLTADELDKRSWSWYVAVRPEVEYGQAGWGAKGPLKLRDILDLRRKP